MLAAYRAGRVPEDVRGRTWQRLLADIDEEEGPPTLVTQATADDEEAPRSEPRRRGASVAVVVMLAAAVVLVVAGLSRRLGPQRGASDNQAVHEVRPSPPPVPTERRDGERTAQPPAPREAPTPRPAPERRVQRPAASEPAASEPAAQQDAGSSLEAELALLRAARAALTKGDPATTLRLVADHERQFLRGHLAEERMVLRAQALCERGEVAAARAAVAALLAAYPESPHASTTATACRE
ncbi:MAG: hypothetical protein JNL82_30910 [Myxococcales bacterium]|nr:hypothetical protein [Myxococcales bacterium]